MSVPILKSAEERARKRLCLPLDGLETIDQIRARVEELSPVVGLFKVGKESFTRFGPAVVEAVQHYSAEVFLDLKYHDIPNTVNGAAQAAARLGVVMFNVHASGGYDMIRAAVEGAYQESKKSGLKVPKVLGVTILTSIDQHKLNDEVGMPGSLEDNVLRLARLSQKAGADGIICSAADLLYIKRHLPNDFMYVTPGIKGPNTPAGADQARVATPGNAIEDGASVLVVGRAITDPKTVEARLEAGYAVLQDMARHLQ